MKFVTFALAAAALAAASSPAAAQNSGEESATTTYAGYYHVDRGYEDRTVVGNFTNLYVGDLGIHTDVAYVDREENGVFGAGGLSYALNDSVRVKAMAGTSRGDVNILPELFLTGSVQLKPAKGWVVTPDVTYRKYRNGGKEISPGVQVAKYFNVAGDTGGYYVAQADGNLSFVDGTDKTGWSAGAGITFVRNSGWNLGLNTRYGYMAYDTVTGTGVLPVRSKVLGLGASVGYRVTKSTEVFVRGNISDTKFYTVSGAMLGVKFGL